jgi:glycosyltransferase involved in cell wall biosynthesis
LHWVGGFIDYTSFFKKCSKPVVWTLHDMNPFMGLKHYRDRFNGIDHEGNPIQRSISKSEEKIRNKTIKIKQKALQSFDKLTVVTPSKWLAEEAKNSILFKDRPVHVIPNGIDSNVFKPRDKNFARDLFDIPTDKKVLLFVSDVITVHRKGFIFLKKALEQIEDDNLILLTLGRLNTTINTKANIVNLGHISNDAMLSLVYSLSDAFIIPSLEDNLPNTVLESLLCGTPVIGFPIGGIPDMIMHGENGLLCDEISVHALRKEIQKFLDNMDIFANQKIRKEAVQI